MTDAAATSILVRVQAKGGKFLANDIGAAEVTIRDAQTGAWLGGGLALGTSSGNLVPGYAPNASLSTIVTPASEPNGVPQVQWLVPVASTSGLQVSLPITRPTLLEITAFGPLGGLQSAHRATLMARPGTEQAQRRSTRRSSPRSRPAFPTSRGR